MNNQLTVTSFILIFLLGFVIQIKAQKVELKNSYPFKDGIYLSFQEFVEDTPSLKLSTVKMEELENSDYNIKVYELTLQDDSLFLSKGIWGLCVEGIPFLNEYYDSVFNERKLMKGKKFGLVVSRIQTIGSISLFAASSLAPGPQNLAANFGLFGVLMDQQFNPKYSPGTTALRILQLKSGKVLDFTPANLLEFINDDVELMGQLNAAKKPKEQMYAILKKYNEAHPFYIE